MSETPDYIPRPALPVSPIVPGATPMEMLARAVQMSASPEILERLLALQERWENNLNRKAFAAALAAAQQQMTTISRDMDNAQTRSKYASLAAVDEAIRPIYSKHGIAISFDTKPSDKGEAWLRIVALAEAAGYSREYGIDMLADGMGAKGAPVMTRIHAAGSAVTYGRRQLLKMIFNLAEADDDGNAAPKSSDEFFVTPEQIKQIEAPIRELAEDPIKQIGRLATVLGIKSLAQLPRSEFDLALSKAKNWATEWKKNATA